MIGRVIGFLLTAVVAIYVGYQWQACYDQFQVRGNRLGPPPSRSGPLALNSKLTNAEKMLENQIHGPESFEIINEKLYTGTFDGKIVEITDGQITKECKIVKDCTTDEECGRPGGVRRLNDDELVVADVYLGILIVNMKALTHRVVLPTGTLVDGVPVTFPDDLDVLDNKTAFFSDASTKWAPSEFPNEMWEVNPSGRLVKVDLLTGEASTVARTLSFANGVQIFPDKESVLVSESTAVRITRVYIAGDKKGQTEVFVDNLPGYPDNIRLSKDGKTFWVGLFTTRFAGRESLYDRFLNYPNVRRLILSTFHRIVKFIIYYISLPKGAIALNIDQQGNIVGSMQDPAGEVIAEVTQVTETDDFFYFANFHRSYFNRLRK
ncbi:hypothetical protein QR680_015191 [Steinernema hermaphroditum]|uniref:Strictosidine synthase conserved region domain-containing protein n=1 Tax=Steinernema hermaphroditum TaxID=289476 RepID=A0AA39M557_9BILA|nr:hypothetical protein QR680_015191 [Steinernema hermaphroditum]